MMEAVCSSQTTVYFHDYTPVHPRQLSSSEKPATSIFTVLQATYTDYIQNSGKIRLNKTHVQTYQKPGMKNVLVTAVSGVPEIKFM
jgi:hypothetical protein